MRAVFSGDLANEAVLKLEVGQMVKDKPDALRAVEAAAGVTQVCGGCEPAGVTGRAFTAKGSKREQSGRPIGKLRAEINDTRSMHKFDMECKLTLRRNSEPPLAPY